MSRLAEIAATVRRYRIHALAQAQVAREIQQLRETARMLFDDKPAKTKALEAVNEMATRRMAMLDARSKALLAAWPALHEPAAPRFTDHGDALQWLLLHNLPGKFPFTAGIVWTGSAEPELSAAAMPLDSDRDAEALAWALADAFMRLERRLAAGLHIDEAAAGLNVVDIGETSGLSAAERDALGCAARRIWAVSMRDCYGASAPGQQLRACFAPTDAPTAADAAGLTDQAEEAVLRELETLAARGAGAPMTKRNSPLKLARR